MAPTPRVQVKMILNFNTYDEKHSLSFEQNRAIVTIIVLQQ